MIEECGWEFRNCHIWDKGMAHAAGNVNTKTIRKYPVVTEVCAQYVRKNRLLSDGHQLPLQNENERLKAKGNSESGAAREILAI